MKGDGRTHLRTDRQKDDRQTLVQINIPFFVKKKAGTINLQKIS